MLIITQWIICYTYLTTWRHFLIFIDKSEDISIVCYGIIIRNFICYANFAGFTGHVNDINPNQSGKDTSHS